MISEDLMQFTLNVLNGLYSEYHSYTRVVMNVFAVKYFLLNKVGECSGQKFS